MQNAQFQRQWVIRDAICRACKNGSDSCWKTAVISPKNIHSSPPSPPTGAVLFPRLDLPPPLFFVSLLPLSHAISLDKNAFYPGCRAFEFEGIFFIVNRFLLPAIPRSSKWKEQFVRGHHRWILHFRLDWNTSFAEEFALKLNFKVKFFRFFFPV